MAASTDALGKCTECAAIYALYKSERGWRVLGTDGNCRCGSSDFTVLSAEEPPKPP